MEDRSRLDKTLFHTHHIHKMVKLLPISALFLGVSPLASGFMFNFNQQQQQQQPPKLEPYEDRVLDNECKNYLCPVTLECVMTSGDCPCPFPKSQLKCVLPNEEIVCISKPATNDKATNDIYDDPVQGPKAHINGMRDCGWVLETYEGSS